MDTFAAFAVDRIGRPTARSLAGRISPDNRMLARWLHFGGNPGARRIVPGGAHRLGKQAPP
jgi:hypothetical protein